MAERDDERHRLTLPGDQGLGRILIALAFLLTSIGTTLISRVRTLRIFVIGSSVSGGNASQHGA